MKLKLKIKIQHLIIKMAPHFDTYYWSKNTVQGCQNTVKGCKMTFGIPFLATSIGVALNRRSHCVSKNLGTEETSYLPICSRETCVGFFPLSVADEEQHENFQSYSHVGIHEKTIKAHLVFAILFCFCGVFLFLNSEIGFRLLRCFLCMLVFVFFSPLLLCGSFMFCSLFKTINSRKVADFLSVNIFISKPNNN